MDLKQASEPINNESASEVHKNDKDHMVVDWKAVNGNKLLINSSIRVTRSSFTNKPPLHSSECLLNIGLDEEDDEKEQISINGLLVTDDVGVTVANGEVEEREEPRSDVAEKQAINEETTPIKLSGVILKSEENFTPIKMDVHSNRKPIQEDTGTKTPILTIKGAMLQQSPSKSEKPADPVFDISPFVKSARYRQPNQQFKMFWLPTSEVSSLIRIPSIAQMSNSQNVLTEKLYIVFTQIGLDVLQDVSHIKGMESRPHHLPFVILYSYSFRSMYFKVVTRMIESLKSASFNYSREDGDVSVSCNKAEERKRRSIQENINENECYEFYRSFLYGVDDGLPKKRISVSLRSIKETVIDMREASVEDESHARLKSLTTSRVVQAEANPKLSGELTPREKQQEAANGKYAEAMSPVIDESTEFDGGASMKRGTVTQSNKRSIYRGPLWIYERTDDHDESDEETVSGLPKVLLSEVHRVIGLEDPSKLLQCNRSMVHHRMEAMIKRNFQLFERDESPITMDVKNNITTLTEEPPDSKARYRVGERVLSVGDVILIKMPSTYKGYPEEDIIKIYDKDTIKLCFDTLESLSTDIQTDLNISLAQFCPNIFWNIVIAGDFESVLRQMAPNLFTKRLRRRSVLRSNPVEAISRQAALANKTNNTLIFDNNFVIMQNLFESNAQHKIQRLEEIRNSQQDSHGKITRKGVSKYLDKEELISAVMDSEGLLLRSMQSLTANQKMVVYQTCLRRGLYAPIKLDYVPGKGRAVFAAHDIGKDEFIVEYKGQIITEKLAKFRDMKYDKSRSYKGSFVFYFKVNNKRYCIDATEEEIVYGPARLINHSRKNPNIVPKALEIDDCPRLFFVAKRDIKCGEELLIDYGERDPSVIKDNPWLLD